MAVNAQAVVSIGVDQKAFDDFMDEFNKYVKLLGQTPKAWGAMTTQQQALVKSFNQGVAALMAQNAVMRKNALLAKDITTHSEKSSFHWDKITGRAKDFAGFVLHAHGHIMKWATVMGGIMTGMGAASGWGLTGLAQWVRGGSISASKLNMASHDLRAVKGLVGEPFGIDVEGIARMVTTAAGNTGSDEYRAVRGTLGIEPGGLKGTKKITDVIEAMIKKMEGGLSPEMLAVQSGGLFNAGELNAMLVNKSDVRKAIAHAPEEAEHLKLSKKTEQTWNDFLTKLEAAGEQVKKILVKGLEPLLDMITSKSPGWIKMFGEFMDSKEVKKFIAEIPEHMKVVWAALQDFGHALMWVAKKMGWIKKTEEEEKAKREQDVIEGAIPWKEMTLEEQRKRSLAIQQSNEELRLKAADFLTPSDKTKAAIRDFGQGGPTFKSFVDTMVNAIVGGLGGGQVGGAGSGTAKFTPGGVPGYQDGTPMVPKTGVYKLHRGEMVLPEADADLLRHSSMADWKRAISGIEGNYRSVNPITGASGKYQVMPDNIRSWTTAALGYPMSKEQFRASPMAQERVFEYMFGQYVSKFGNPLDAASAWFTGQPIVGNRSGPDAMGTSLNKYLRLFMQGLGASGGRMGIDINDNTGGNVAMALSQMATVSLPLHPV